MVKKGRRWRRPTFGAVLKIIRINEGYSVAYRNVLREALDIQRKTSFVCVYMTWKKELETL